MSAPSPPSVGDRRADVAVVGAGIVGLAVARALSLRHPRLRLVVLDKETGIARHQTGRSSGVIHSGVYYAPGSLKARLCVQGAAALRAYCDERAIPYIICGKVIVATEAAEVPRLEELHRRGTENGAPGLELIGPERLRELEPHAAGVRHCTFRARASLTRRACGRCTCRAPGSSTTVLSRGRSRKTSRPPGARSCSATRWRDRRSARDPACVSPPRRAR